MKRNSALRLSSLLFVLFLLVALTACVRTIDNGDDSGGADLPTAEPLVMPTAVPIDEPIAEPTAVIEDTPEDTPEETADPAGEGDAENTTEEPAETPPDAEEPGETAETPSTYTVQSGDTLGGIAEQFGVTLEALAAANGITNLDTLDVGQVLNIPIPGAEDTTATEPADTPATEEQIHIVKAGENLFRIGLAYGFTIDELAEYNGITDPNDLEVGQEIKIPPSN